MVLDEGREEANSAAVIRTPVSVGIRGRFFADQDNPENDKEIAVKPAQEEVKKEVEGKFEDLNVKQEETKVDNMKIYLKNVVDAEATKALKEKVNEKIVVGRKIDLNFRTPKGMVSTPSLVRSNSKSKGVTSARKLRKDLTQSEYTDKNETNWKEISSWFKKINKYNHENKATEDNLQEETKIQIKETNDNTPRQEGTLVAKEFLRTEVDESEDTFIMKMLIENKANETCLLEFPYSPSKDSPAIVAKEMVIALSLDEVDIPRIQDAIQKEIYRHTLPNTSNQSVGEESRELGEENVMKESMREHIDAIIKFSSTLSNKEEVNMEEVEGMEELDKAFMLEIFKLSKRYQKKQQEFLNRGIIN
jgi:hypothetical protein